MNHEIYAIFLYLLHKSGYKIDITYNITKFTERLIQLLKIKSKDYSIEELLSYNDIAKIKIEKDNKIKHYSLTYVISRLNNNNFEPHLPVIDNIYTKTLKQLAIRKDSIKFDKDSNVNENELMKFIFGPTFRKLIYNITILTYQSFFFYYLFQVYKILNIENKNKLNNPIDDRLWNDRTIQKALLCYDELNNHEDAFGNLMDSFIVDCDNELRNQKEE